MKALAAFCVAVVALGLRAETPIAPAMVPSHPHPVMLAIAGVVPNTPSGVGDPNAVVCRAPQPIPGSEQLGPQVCLHNSEWWKVAVNGKDVGPDGKSLIAKATVDNPTGHGDPDAVTCRTGKAGLPPPGQLPQNGSDARWEICRTNRFWADVIKNDQVVDARGIVRPSNRGEANVYPTRPSGNGDPNSTSCYLQVNTHDRVAKKVCKTNAEWARDQTGINRYFYNATVPIN